MINLLICCFFRFSLFWVMPTYLELVIKTSVGICIYKKILVGQDMKRVNVFDNKKIENSFCFKNCVQKNKLC